MKSFWITVLTLLTAALPAMSGVGIWTPVGPYGGIVRALAVDPAAPDTLYAGAGLGIFKSTDRGETWTVASRGLGTLGAEVVAFAAAPGVLYAGTRDSGVFKSTDGGRIWTSASVGLPHSILSLAVDPRSPDKIWAGTPQAVFFSTDGGATWQSRRSGFPKKVTVQALAVDPDGGWVHAGTRLGVWRSSDEGRTWQQTAQGLPVNLSVNDLGIEPGTPSTIYAATSGGIYRSTDRGKTWKRLAETLAQSVYAIAVEGDRVYAVDQGRTVVLSSDRGATWQIAAQAPGSPFLIALAAAPGVVYVGAYAYNGNAGGVLRSLDRGATWEEALHGLLGLPVLAVAVDPSDPDVLLASTRDSGIFRSTDRGATWKAVGLQYTELLVFDPSDPGTVYGGNLRSEDSGQTWTRTGPPSVRDIAFDTRQLGALWGAIFFGLYHSADRGDHWVKQALPQSGDFSAPSPLAVEVDPHDPRIVYVAWYTVAHGKPKRFIPRILRSTDGGKSWKRRDVGLPQGAVKDLAVDPADSTLYLATATGLYRSTDRALTWKRLSGLSGGVDQVAVGSPGVVYAAVAGVGVMRSADHGQTWKDIKLGLGPIPLLDLVVDPTEPDRLYAATSTRGIYSYEEP
jgi:photosystem II stability/assembly factor-like uncharacterized protein